MKHTILIVAACALVSGAYADVTVSVRTEEGRAVSDGVVNATQLSTPDSGSLTRTPFIPLRSGEVSFELPPGQYRLSYWSQAVVPISIIVNGSLAAENSYEVILSVGEDPVRVEFTLPKFYRISGKVLDAQGESIPGVDISGIELGYSDLSITTHTESDGSFVILANHLPVVLTPSSSDSISFSPESFTARDEQHVVFLAQKSQGTLIKGRVVDSNGGPLGGMNVASTYACPVGVSEPNKATTTGPEGQFEIRCSNECENKIRAYRNESDYIRSRVLVAPGDCGRKLVIEMKRGMVLKGTILDSEDEPVQHLPLVLNKSRPGTTNKHGRFRFAGLEDGEYDIEINSRRASKEQRGLVLDFKPIRIDEETEVTLTALAGGQICLTVTNDVGDQVPVGKIEAFHWTDGELASRRAVNESDEKEEPGRLCTPSLPTGDYRVRVHGSSFESLWWPGVSSEEEAQPVSVGPEETTSIGPLFILSEPPG